MIPHQSKNTPNTHLTGPLGFVTRNDMLQTVNKLEVALRRTIQTLDEKITEVNQHTSEKNKTEYLKLEDLFEKTFRIISDTIDRTNSRVKKVEGSLDFKFHTITDNIIKRQDADKRDITNLMSNIWTGFQQAGKLDREKIKQIDTDIHTLRNDVKQIQAQIDAIITILETHQ